MVNLAPAQAAVERLMGDRCRIRRNPGGSDDDVLNPNPGELTLDPGVEIEPYYDGICSARAAAGGTGEDASSITVPLSVVPLEDDAIEVYESRDAAMVGRWFRVDRVMGGTFAVSRRLQVAEIAPWQ
jgi:hypothetical protein